MTVTRAFQPSENKGIAAVAVGDSPMTDRSGDVARCSDDAERLRVHRLQRLERRLWAMGMANVAGVDEAGRGPLAGPVVAAAVILPLLFTLDRVDDSKRLRPEVRGELHTAIMRAAVAVGVGIVDEKTIDRINILEAALKAMDEAVRSLCVQPDFILVDGNRLPLWEFPSRAVIGGDRASFSVAAASIVAKVTRDRIMVEYHRVYPEYGFDRHKGYGTPQHIAAISKFGLSDIHRRSFRLHGGIDNREG